MSTNILNQERVKECPYIIKINTKLVGIKVKEEDFDFYKKGGMELIIADMSNNDFLHVNIGNSWLFIFSEIIELYNNIDIETYSHKWKFLKNKYGNDYDFELMLVYNSDKRLLITIEYLGKKLNLTLDESNMYELIMKMIDAVQDIKNFKFTVHNEIDYTRNLSVAKINKKSGTIINTFNGVDYQKPFLSESDKYQVKYSAIHRILYGVWLSVKAERINISVNGIITTIDEEYILDITEKNKSSMVALILLSSLCFKDENE
jgi:hypothetical protein